MRKKISFFCMVAMTSFVTACQTYTEKNVAIRNQMYSGHLSDALALIDNSDLATENRNFTLFRMEKGMLLYLDAQYSKANTLWIEADRHIDDLYTTSISNTANSFIINDSMSDYRGEAHERVLLPLFASLAFFEQGNIENSAVMIRRTYHVMNVLTTENEGKNTFQNDVLPYYLSGMILEAKGEIDNALVEYQHALSIAQQKEVKEKISEDVGRLASFRNRKDIVSKIKKAYPNLSWKDQSFFQKNGELYFIYESGNSPIKRPAELLLPTDRTVVRISFPEYVAVPYQSHYLDVSVDNQSPERTLLIGDIGMMARNALQDRKLRDLAKMTARIVAKDIATRKLAKESPLAGLAANIFTLSTEVADTRSWTTLPDTIQILRIPLTANREHKIQITPQIGPEKTFTLQLHPGEKRLYRLRTFN